MFLLLLFVDAFGIEQAVPEGEVQGVIVLSRQVAIIGHSQRGEPTPTRNGGREHVMLNNFYVPSSPKSGDGHHGIWRCCRPSS